MSALGGGEWLASRFTPFLVVYYTEGQKKMS